MEVRRASRKSAQDRSLNLANIGALSGDHRSTQVGDLVGRSGIRSRITEYGKDRQVINIKGLDGPSTRGRIEGTGIGDSDIDVLTARNAGLWSCGVTYGFAPHTLEATPPDVLIDSPAEL